MKTYIRFWPHLGRIWINIYGQKLVTNKTCRGK